MYFLFKIFAEWRKFIYDPEARTVHINIGTYTNEF